MFYRYFIELAYKGTHYHGWQVQPNAVSVQEILNTAFSTVLREETELTGCGRTDTGVHASYFVAHFDSQNDSLHQNKNFLYSINGVLPQDIVIKSVHCVDNDFHSRFSALTRTYHYVIRHEKDPFRTEFSTYIPQPLNINLMNEACAELLGEMDFSSFCKAKSNTHTNICKVLDAFWKPIDNEFVFTIKADRFLRNMVRAVVGTMIAIGQEKLTKKELREIIDRKDRSYAGPSVPAHGLYLTDVTYPPGVFKRTTSNLSIIE
ncbi:MAG: tRNA pseudouridine(38-40) synthase TruA [Bacteroidota bacterium]